MYSNRSVTARRPRTTVLRRMAVAGVVAAGVVGFAPTAQAAQVSPDVGSAPVSAPVSGPPSIQPLDCSGTTGVRGCGGGWHWRDGWYGFGCYPC